MRIACWSGPRNISTAMMRSFGNRTDTFVTDEPLYAHYLKITGLPHPGADEIIQHHESDWKVVVAWLTGDIPNGKSVWYQKHMAHHLLPGMDQSWLETLTNVFLIREPREMITSLMKVTPNPRVEDTGLPQQLALFNRLRDTHGTTPPVVDSREVLENPRDMLMKLCAVLDLSFDEAMLHWPPGPRETDGIWAKHWYANVEQSTGFTPYKPKEEPVPTNLHDVLRECEDCYAVLYDHRLR